MAITKNEEKQILLRIGHVLRNIIVEQTVPKKTGELARSINVQETKTGAKVGTNKIYGAYINYGNLRNKILTPRAKKALFWPGAKHPVKSIKRPKPTLFMEKALKILTDEKEKVIEKVAPHITGAVKKQLLKNIGKIKVNV